MCFILSQTAPDSRLPDHTSLFATLTPTLLVGSLSNTFSKLWVTRRGLLHDPAGTQRYCDTIRIVSGLPLGLLQLQSCVAPNCATAGRPAAHPIGQCNNVQGVTAGSIALHPRHVSYIGCALRLAGPLPTPVPPPVLQTPRLPWTVS
jgi:hypothetical protein